MVSMCYLRQLYPALQGCEHQASETEAERANHRRAVAAVTATPIANCRMMSGNLASSSLREELSSSGKLKPNENSKKKSVVLAVCFAYFRIEATIRGPRGPANNGDERSARDQHPSAQVSNKFHTAHFTL